MNDKTQANIITVLMFCAVAAFAFCAVGLIFEVGPIGRWAAAANARNVESFWQRREAKYLAAGFRIERMTAHDSLVLIRADGERFLVTFRQSETSSTSVVPLAKQTPEETKP